MKNTMKNMKKEQKMHLFAVSGNMLLKLLFLFFNSRFFFCKDIV